MYPRHVSVIVSTARNKHETEVARLRGARLVVCSEQTSGKSFDEAKIKKFTGGDRLSGRFMRGDFFDFRPSHLIIVLSNHLPAVKEGVPSFWRRVRLIPFNHAVPEDQQVKNLDQILLKAEGPAILGWAAKGAIEVLVNGLQDPEKVIKATHNYEVSEDSLASYVQDDCFVGPAWHCQVSSFRSRYVQHCQQMDAEPLSARALSMRLVNEFGVTLGRSAKQRTYDGISYGKSEAGDDT
jgi:putative DNA primase/helicase